MSQREGFTQEWHISNHIHPLLHEGGIVYFNSETGMWGTTPRRFGAVLLKAAAVKHPGLTWPELMQPQPPDTPKICASFAAAKLLIAGNGRNPPLLEVSLTEDTELLPIGTIPAIRNLMQAKTTLPSQDKVVQKNLERAIRLIHEEPFQKLVEEIRGERSSSVATATIPQAVKVAATVRQVSDWYPGKFDCLEHSVATVLVAARVGLHVDLQLGASVDPINYHAWPAVQGQPVVLSDEMPIAGHFHPVFTI